jgi:uncharacterized ion transporter superfamily protein YfcC
MLGSAFGPTNPFQAGIALRLAQLPGLAAGGLRLAAFIIALAVWIAWTMWHARRYRTVGGAATSSALSAQPSALKHRVALVVMLLPMAAYVYGVMKYDWGFSELGGGFLIGGIAAGLIGGFGVIETLNAYVEGMQTLLPAGLLIGVARAISLVLEDGRVVDTILNAFASALGRMPPVIAAFVMVPFQMLLHVLVPSVSGQAVLTMPLMVPLADLLHLPRVVAVLAYTTGAGLAEFLTPTNGALLAIVVAAGVPFQKWLRFAIGGVAIALLIGLAVMALALRTSAR